MLQTRPDWQLLPQQGWSRPPQPAQLPDVQVPALASAGPQIDPAAVHPPK
jgi:hypothetical protein